MRCYRWKRTRAISIVTILVLLFINLTRNILFAGYFKECNGNCFNQDKLVSEITPVWRENGVNTKAYFPITTVFVQSDSTRDNKLKDGENSLDEQRKTSFSVQAELAPKSSTSYFSKRNSASGQESPKKKLLRLKIVSTSKHEWMTCDDIKLVRRQAVRSKSGRRQKENDIGNKAVFLTEINYPNGTVVKVVIKSAYVHASGRNRFFSYYSAIKEIQNLRKLISLKLYGTPALFGACITSTTVIYVVEFIPGIPLCSGSGYDKYCISLQSLKKDLQSTVDSALATTKFLSKLDSAQWENLKMSTNGQVTQILCFFRQFEEHNIFMEDLSGSNLFYIPDTFDIYIVDADSLVFYDGVPMLSRMSCKRDEDCPQAKSYLWGDFHQAIFSSCDEVHGNCVNATCRGLASSTQSCAIGNWILSSLQDMISVESQDMYESIKKCMTMDFPRNRCSLQFACKTFDAELNAY